MKANELMIGDIVTFKDCLNDEEILFIKIWRLSQEGNALVFIYDSKVLDEISIDDEIVGIPLTTEILEKNGFTKGGMFGKTYYLAIGDFEVSVYFANANTQLVIEKRNGTTMINLFNAGNVHKLQHALKLCGIEKEIVL